MHELACPSCNAASQYDLKDYLHMCPVCSVTFRLDMESGQKEIYSDHFIVPNAVDPRAVKNLVMEWLRRLHHNPGVVDQEYFVVDILGYSIPYWIVSLEAHTAWKGLVRRHHRSRLESGSYSSYLTEEGVFRRNYRWAVTARNNLCENWGMTRLHVSREGVPVDWDGFPLDSTFSRGRIDDRLGVRKASAPGQPEEDESVYNIREFFEFKYANGLPILNVQVSEEEALRRARSHVDNYHRWLAKLNTDIHIDARTELEIAGIQLLHLPFWYARYVYKPRNLLRYFHQPRERNVVLDGFNGGVLNGELAVVHKDKLWVNSIVCGMVSLVLFFLGAVWHPAMLLAAGFMVVVAFTSAYLAAVRARQKTQIGEQNIGESDSEADAAEQTDGLVEAS